MTIKLEFALVSALALFLGLSQAQAGQIDLLLESDVDGNAGSEIFLANFNSRQSFLDGDLNQGVFSSLNISSSFSVGGLAFDGFSYQMLLESDTDSSGGSEIFLASFDSYQSVLDGDLSSGAFSQLNISSGFSVGGLAYDDTGYQLLLESNTDASAGDEVFLASFSSYQNLLDGTLSSGAFSQLNISSSFSTGGFAYDGLSYQLLLESDTDAGQGNELFLAAFDSIQSLLDADLSSGSFVDLNISASYSAGGLVAHPDVPTITVSEPGAAVMVLWGLAGLFTMRWYSRKRLAKSW